MSQAEIASEWASPKKSTIGRAEPSGSKDQRAPKKDGRAAPEPLRFAFRTLSRWAPSATVPVARRVFLTPPRFRAPTRELWWQTEAECFEIPFGGGRLAAWRWGHHGPAVVLIHGWGGRGLQMGAFAAPLVDAGFQVFTVDLPAHGISHGRSSSLPEAADAIATVLAMAVEKRRDLAGVIAHSFGGAATALALVSGAHRPRKLAFIGAPGDLDTVLQRFSQMTGFSLDVMGRLRADLERRFKFQWESVHPYRLGRQIDIPLLVVHDRHDEETSWRDGQSLARSWPDAEFISTAGLGHFRILRDDGVIRHLVEYFTAEPTSGIGAKSAA